MTWFTGKDAALEQAIDRDDVAGLEQAVRNGANVNARGRAGVNPLEYAVGHFKKNTFEALLRLKANSNQRDDEQDNAVTLAQRAFNKDPSYLDEVLRAGGDPNTRDSSNNPIIEGFLPFSNVKGIRLLQQHGADLNVTQRDGIPILVNAISNQFWTSAWTLLQLGARYDYKGVHGDVGAGFRSTEIIDPKSPRFQDRRRCWEFLHSKGVKLPPLEEPHG